MLVAAVLVISALASPLVERAPVSFPLIFLAIGVLLGGQGLGVLRIELHDPTLEIVATLSLALVLFLDAVKLRLDEARRGWRIPALVLGPGTALTIAIDDQEGQAAVGQVGGGREADGAGAYDEDWKIDGHLCVLRDELG